MLKEGDYHKIQHYFDKQKTGELKLLKEYFNYIFLAYFKCLWDGGSTCILPSGFNAHTCTN